MPTNDRFDINVDLVFCIDITGSMDPIIDKVKESVLGFHERLTKELEDYGRDVQELRVKIVGFRDFDCDGQMSIEKSDFFVLPSQEDELHAFVSKLRAEGGGDVPETAIDAISIAMDSDWVTEGQKRRHVIIMLTDAPTKGPGHSGNDRYPSNMEEFVKWWQDPQEGKMNRQAQRLIVYAPDDESWEFVEALENSIWEKTVPENGMSEVAMETILACICNSI